MNLIRKVIGDAPRTDREGQFTRKVIGSAPGAALEDQFNAVFFSGSATPLKPEVQERRWAVVTTPPKKEIK